MPRLLAAGILLALSVPALGSEAPRLAIVGVHEAGLDEAGQQEAIEKLAESVDMIGMADGIETPEVIRAIRGREEVILADALLAHGRLDLLNGKNLYNQAQTEDALTALQSAVEDLSLGVAATNSVKELWEAWIYLGTAHLQNDNQQVAESCFRAAAALNPDRNPNPALFPPDVVAAFQAQRDLLAKVAVDVTIEADRDATIFLDGREIGPSPALAGGVYPGMHHVAAKTDGGYAYKLLRLDQVAEGEQAPTVSLQLGQAVIGTAAESKHLKSRQIAGLYRALGTHADKVDLFLIAGITEGNVAMQLYSPRADAFSRPVTSPADRSTGEVGADNMASLMELVTPDGKILPEAIHPLALPLGLDENAHLASLLMDPRDPAEVTKEPEPVIVEPPPKKKSPVVPIVVSVLVAGAAGTSGYFGYTALSNNEPKYGGSVVIEF